MISSHKVLNHEMKNKNLTKYFGEKKKTVKRKKKFSLN